MDSAEHTASAAAPASRTERRPARVLLAVLALLALGWLVWSLQAPGRPDPAGGALPAQTSRNAQGIIRMPVIPHTANESGTVTLAGLKLEQALHTTMPAKAVRVEPAGVSAAE